MEEKNIEEEKQERPEFFSTTNTLRIEPTALEKYDSAPLRNRRLRKSTFKQKSLARKELERYYSMQVSSAVFDESILKKLITAEVRRNQIKSYARWSTMNLLIIIYLVVLLIFEAGEADHYPCDKQIDMWLIGYLIIMVLHIVKKICMICFWNRGEDPKEMEVKLNLLYMILVFIPEISWYIYGGIFIHHESMDPCKEFNEGRYATSILYHSVLVLVIFGYIYLCFILLVFCVYGIVFCQWRQWQKLEVETEDTCKRK